MIYLFNFLMCVWHYKSRRLSFSLSCEKIIQAYAFQFFFQHSFVSVIIAVVGHVQGSPSVNFFTTPGTTPFKERARILGPLSKSRSSTFWPVRLSASCIRPVNSFTFSTNPDGRLPCRV